MKNTGGPAFPSSTDFYGGPNKEYGSRGLTLRDYFAAKAMQSLLTTEYTGAKAVYEGWDGSLAHEAYMVADAMLKARTEP